MVNALILASIIIISAIILSKATDRFGVPSLMIFLALGILFGEEGLGGLAFSNYALTEQICTVGLIFIIFYGGFGMSWKAAKPVAPQAIILSSIGTISTALIVALLAYQFLGLGAIESFLLGSVISSTDAASVFSILRQRRLNLKDGLASLLEMESGSNDPFSYMLTFVALLLLQGGADAFDVSIMVVQQLAVGALLGALVAWITIQAFKRFDFGAEGYDALLVLAVSIASYAIPTALGGNGYLAAYIAGILLGNSVLANKADIVHFFDGLTHLSQIIIFFVFGLLAFPSRLAETFFLAIAVFAFITLLARPLALGILLIPFKRSLRENVLLSISGLRGAASLVFAVFTVSALSTAGTPISFDIFHVVFWIVLFSIALQGSLIAPAAKVLNLVDDSQSVMKTFTDYIDDTSFSLVEIEITPGSPLDGTTLSDANLTHKGLAVLIKRGEESMLPQGSTILHAGDIVVFNIPTNQTLADDISLNETQLLGNHPWINHQIKQIRISPEALVVLIRRDDSSIIPDGSTKLLEGDVLLISGDIPSDPAAVVVNR